MIVRRNGWLLTALHLFLEQLIVSSNELFIAVELIVTTPKDSG